MSNATSNLESIALVALKELQRLSEGPSSSSGPSLIGSPAEHPKEGKDAGVAPTGDNEATTSPPVDDGNGSGIPSIPLAVLSSATSTTTITTEESDGGRATPVVPLESLPGSSADCKSEKGEGTIHPVDSVITVSDAKVGETVRPASHQMGDGIVGPADVSVPVSSGASSMVELPNHVDQAGRSVLPETVASLSPPEKNSATIADPSSSVPIDPPGSIDTSSGRIQAETDFFPANAATADFSHILADPEAWLRSTENLYVGLPPVDTKQSIHRILADDVLCGRGGETNHFTGNCQYRSLVKAFQKLYIESKRREKPKIAQCIVYTVRKAGGRFLKRTDPGSNAWVDVGNTKAREKTSQALREGAPDLRGSEVSQQDQESASASIDSGDEECPTPSAMVGGYTDPRRSASFHPPSAVALAGAAAGKPTLPRSANGGGAPNPAPAADGGTMAASTISERIAASLLQNPLFHRLSPFQQQQVLMGEIAAARHQEQQLHGYAAAGGGSHALGRGGMSTFSSIPFQQQQQQQQPHLLHNHNRGFHGFACNDGITTVHGDVGSMQPNRSGALGDAMLLAKLAVRKAAAETAVSAAANAATSPSLAGAGNLLKRPSPDAPHSHAAAVAAAASGAAVIVVSDSDGSEGSSLSSLSPSGGPRLKRLKMRRQLEVPSAAVAVAAAATAAAGAGASLR